MRQGLRALETIRIVMLGITEYASYSDATKLLNRKAWRTLNDYNSDRVSGLYSLLPNEIWGKKDLGENLWNEGRTDEIRNRVLHLGCD